MSEDLGFSDGELADHDTLPIRPEGSRVRFVCASVKDKHILPTWIASLGEDPNPVRRDAVELAGLAFKRWRAATRERKAAASLGDLRDLVTSEKNAEVTVLILAKVPGLSAPRLARKVAGVCAFHRTWCNNIYLDYLAVHPVLYHSMKATLKGVGSAMLWYVTLVARDIDAGLIWGEATPVSHGFYGRVLGKRVRDMIRISKAEYIAFAKKMKKMADEKAKGAIRRNVKSS